MQHMSQIQKSYTSATSYILTYVLYFRFWGLSALRSARRRHRLDHETTTAHTNHVWTALAGNAFDSASYSVVLMAALATFGSKEAVGLCGLTSESDDDDDWLCAAIGRRADDQ